VLSIVEHTRCLEAWLSRVWPHFPKFGCNGSSVCETVTDKSVKSGQSGDALRASINFMDTGTWTLRCHRCNKTFEVELKPTERTIQYAQKTPCPHCNTKPAEAKRLPTLWHQIIGFRAVTPHRLWSIADSNNPHPAPIGTAIAKGKA